MKAITISINGVENKKPVIVNGASGKYLAFVHGENGRGRWQYRIPLSVREFPVPEISETHCGPHYVDLGEQEFRLINLHKKDHKGNDLFLAVKGENDSSFLVFWYLSPGYRGGANYSITGSAKLLALGKEAQGIAGRMGGADCPILVVNGPSRLIWTRFGRLYGEPADWVASFDGSKWIVQPIDDCELEDAAFSW